MDDLRNDLVLRDDDGPVATLTLNRPDKANVLSSEMMDALEDAVRAADADPEIRVIVLAARGRIFCAGHDLGQLLGIEDQSAHEALFARCSRLMGAIRAARKPVIARVQGAAVAAGCQLVATCDLAYAAEGAKFGVNGIDLGLFCSTPSVALSRAVLPKQALELLLTGKLVTAQRAVEMGLINAAVPADRLDATVAEIATVVAAKSPGAIEIGKALFWSQLGLDTGDAYDAAGEAMATNMAQPETRQLIGGFVAKRG